MDVNLTPSLQTDSLMFKGRLQENESVDLIFPYEFLPSQAPVQQPTHTLELPNTKELSKSKLFEPKPPQLELKSKNVPHEQQQSQPNQISNELKVYSRLVQPNLDQRQVHDSESRPSTEIKLLPHQLVSNLTLIFLLQ